MNVDKEVAEAVLSKAARHLWYLHEEVVALSFFDDEVPPETKQKMADNALASVVSAPQPKGVVLKTTKAILDFASRDLDTFVTPRTLDFFKCAKVYLR